MKIRLFLLLVVVALATILSSCGENVDAFLTDAVAYPMKPEQLNVQKLSASADYYAENVLSYENDSNETVLRIYSAPIEDSENAISKQDGGSYFGDGKFMKKSLPEAWSLDNPITVTSGSNFAEIAPADQGGYTSEIKSVANIFGQIRDTVVYKDAFGKGIDLNCSVTSFGVNFEIVFSKHPEQNTYQIKTALEKGEVRTILETPLIADKNGKWSYANSVRLVVKDSTTGTYTVEYTVNEAFLSNKSTQYPVKVNQSVSLYKSKQPDTTAY